MSTELSERASVLDEREAARGRRVDHVAGEVHGAGG